MNWTPESSPNENSNYDHIICETPLGRMIIEWKSWKVRPSYHIMLEGIWIGAEYSLDEAKQRARNYLIEKLEELKRFLEMKNLP